MSWGEAEGVIMVLSINNPHDLHRLNCQNTILWHASVSLSTARIDPRDTAAKDDMLSQMHVLLKGEVRIRFSRSPI